MPLQYQQVYINNFDGGITENYINANVNQYKTADNFIIEDGGLRLRYGNRVIFNKTSSERVMGMYDLNDELYYTKGDSFYKLDDGNYQQAKTYAELQAPIVTSPDIRDAKNAEWELTELLSGDKVYVTFILDHGSIQIDPTQAAALPNIGYILTGYERFNHETPILPDLGTFFDVADSTSYPSASEWRDQLHVTNTGIKNPTTYNYPMRVWKESEGPDVFKATQLGLPVLEPAAPFTQMVFPLAPDASPSPAYQYIYSFIYEYEYFVGDIKFKNVSPVHTELVGTAAPIDNVNYVEITNVPVLNEARLDNANIKIGVYRSQNGESTLYKIAEFSNGFAGLPPFVDSIIDDDITTAGVDENYNPIDDAGILLYTEGGLSEHFRPPRCKYLMVVNDIAYYMNVIEETTTGDEIRPYRFVQSVPNAPAAVDNTAFEDLDDTIVGGSHINGLPIIFTKSFIYRIEGAIQADGTGTIRKRVISDTDGCISHQGIVRTSRGIFFAGNNGILVTDGYRTEVLTDELDETYSELISTIEKSDRVIAAYDARKELIYWGFSEIEDENDVCWVYNIKRGGFTRIRGIQMKFSSLLFFQKYIIRGDDQGYMYEFNEDDRSDVRRDLTVAFATDWEKERIDFEYETAAIDGGNPHLKKWGHECTISLTSDVPATIGMFSNNDDGEKVLEMKPITLFGSIIWRADDFVWRDDDFQWRASGTQSRQRRFPRTSARFRRKQIKMKPTKINLYKSDSFTLADVTVDPSDPDFLFVDITGNALWPKNITEDIIRFDADDYFVGSVIDESINERISDTRLRIRSGQVAPGTGKRWTIYGYRRSQALEIRAVSATFAPIANIGDEYRSSESGGNS
jgi:hypothetical protein